MRARKRFGQNFLIDDGVINRILDAIQPKPKEHIVEIGPGHGALTDWLVRFAGKLSVIEIDRDLVKKLVQKYQQDHVEVVSGDALKVDFSALGEDIRVVGNLPYNISTPLLFHLTTHRRHIIDMHFMLQREVVERIVAPPGSKAYGRLSVMLQREFEAEQLFDVPPDAFNPAPKVWSSIVRLTPVDTKPRVNSEQQFAQLVSQAFSQRRKTIRNSLKGLLSADQIIAAGCEPTARPEVLSGDDFVNLANKCTVE
ncbi:MAG: 16S rRNA (adenine(1518)-N(6)/adenine(1519)-N(6))-dimethyltransferase RsmA [Pseudomonadota bacterium]